MKKVVNEYYEVVKCGCGGSEYYGQMHWRDGHQYCRHCIESIWRNDGWQKGRPYEDAFKHYFPYYEDGKDYRTEIELVEDEELKLCLCGEEVEELFFDSVTNEIGCENCAFLCLDCERLVYLEDLGEYCPYCGCRL